jgi:hypothetical protein
MRLDLTYRLTGTGWAECTLSDENSSCTVTASYLSDALRHLVVAATAVVSGFSRITFQFDEEPGEYRWVIETLRMNEIELRVLEFPELYGEKPDADGKEIFRTKCLPVTFAAAVCNATADLLAMLGESGYAAQWCEHPFPTLQFQELQRLLELEARDV